ncbi:hypothetical protein C8R43DRAFT_1119541 [Mycena crocata]|nr:hypothetical protein C8R43DRAFT_1119541 [Mycena crocata]
MLQLLVFSVCILYQYLALRPDLRLATRACAVFRCHKAASINAHSSLLPLRIEEPSTRCSHLRLNSFKQSLLRRICWVDKKSLRATCRTVNFALEPLVLSHLIIDPVQFLDASIGRLALLADPSCRNSTLVKSVDICYLTWPELTAFEREGKELLHDLDVLRQSLVPALSSMHNLRSLRWQLDSQEDSTGEEASIVDALISLPHFSDLEFLLPESGKSGLPPLLPFHRLSNLRTVSLFVPPRTAEWTRILERVVHPLAEAIAHSPTLESLTIEQENSSDRYHADEERNWHLDEFPNVKHPITYGERPCFHHLVAKVDAQQPLRLNCLQLRGDFLHLDDAHLAHIRCLNKLAFDPPSAGVIYEDDTPREKYAPKAHVVAMWKTLTDEMIFPPAFQSAAPTDEHALQYLRSHPGLQRLDLTQIESLYDPRDFDVYADLFFENILPRHTETLTHLAITPGRHGRWALTKRNAGAILQCRALVELGVELKLMMKIDYAVLLLDIALDLPHLKTLTITMTQGWYGQESKNVCGTGRMRWRNKWYSATRHAVEHYRFLPETTTPMTLMIFLECRDDGMYRLRPSVEADGSMQFVYVVDESRVKAANIGPGSGLGLGLEYYDQAYASSLPAGRRIRIEDLVRK